MAWYICQACGEKKDTFWSLMFRCPNCMKIYCNEHLKEPGVGFIRRGFCPYCGTEIHDEHQCKD